MVYPAGVDTIGKQDFFLYKCPGPRDSLTENLLRFSQIKTIAAIGALQEGARQDESCEFTGDGDFAKLHTLSRRARLLLFKAITEFLRRK